MPRNKGWHHERHRHSMAAKGVKTTMDPMWRKLGKDLASGKQVGPQDFYWDSWHGDQPPVAKIAAHVRKMGKGAKIFEYDFGGSEEWVIVAKTKKEAAKHILENEVFGEGKTLSGIMKKLKPYKNEE